MAKKRKTADGPADDDAAGEARRLVRALSEVHWADPKKYRRLPEARAILNGSPELQASAAREAIEHFRRLRDKVPGRSIGELLNLHFNDGYAEPLFPARHHILDAPCARLSDDHAVDGVPLQRPP